MASRTVEPEKRSGGYPTAQEQELETGRRGNPLPRPRPQLAFNATRFLTLGNIAVRDPDPRRALETARLIRTLAPQLGISGRVNVRIGDDADTRLASCGAEGLAENGKVLLPGTFHPATVVGRYVLGHELTHAAQTERGNGSAPSHIEDAEAEAESIGAAIALQMPFAAPQVLAPSTSSLALAKQPEQQIKDLQALAAHHEKEKNYIKKQLHGWWVSDSDVNRCLEALQAVPFFVGVGIIQRLTDGERYDLVNNINGTHYKRFRTQIFECYAALSEKQFERFDEDLLSNIDLHEITPEEHWAIKITFDHLPKKAQQKLMKSKNEQPLREILQAEPLFDEKKLRELHKQAEEDQETEKKRGEEHAKFGPEGRLKRIKDDVVKLLNHPNSGNILSALDLLSPMLHELPELAALAHELDEDESLDKLVEKAPIEEIFKLHSESDTKKEGSEKEQQQKEDSLRISRRHVFVFVAGQRAAYKNIALVEKLTHSWFFDLLNPLDQDEAQFTFELIKAAPPALRKSFQGYNEGKYWKRVSGAMSPSTLTARGTNLYGGGVGQLDRASLTSALLNDELWTPANAEELDGRIRMAIAAGEGQFVFDVSEQREIYKKQPDLLPLVDKYGLYNPQVRMANGSVVAHTHYQPDIGVKDTPGVIGAAWRTINKIAYDNDTLYGEGIDGLDLQKLMGGTIQGLQLKEHPDVAKVPSVDTGEPDAPINYVDRLELNLNKGDLFLGISGLAIEKLNYLYGDMAIQGSAGMIKGLGVTGKFPVTASPKLSYLKLEISSIELADVTLVFGDSIIAINKVELGGLHYFAGSDNADAAKIEKPQKFLLGCVYVLETLYGLLRVAWNSEDLTKGLTTSRKLSATVDSFKLTGVTTSSGRFIKFIDGQGVAFRSGATKDQYQWALQETQKAFPGRIAKAKQKQAGAKTAEEREQYEAAIRQLDRQQKSVETALANLVNKPADSRGGIDVDVDQLDINTGSKDLKLMALHGHGRVSQFKEDDPARPVLLKSDTDAQIAISLGEVSTGGIDIPKSPPSRKVMEARIAKLDKKIAERQANGLPVADQWTAREELKQQLADVADYESLAARGIPELTAQEQKRFIELRDKLNKESSAHIGEVSIEGGTLDLGFGGTQADGLAALADIRNNLKSVALNADRVQLKNVSVAGKGIDIDRIEATGVNASVERGGEGTAHIKGTRIVAEGIHLARTEAALHDQAEKYKQVLKTGGTLTDGEQRKLDKVTAALDQLEEIQISCATAYEHLRFAKSLQAQQAAEDEVQACEKQLDAWSETVSVGRIGFDSPDFQISGIGDVLDPDAELNRAADPGLNVSGEFSGVTAEDINTGSTSIKKVTGGKGGASLKMQDDRIDLDDFHIESLDVSGVDYSGGTRSVSTEGTTKITGISLKGAILFDQKIQNKQKKEEIFTVVHIDDFLINKIEAAKIVYRQPLGADVLSVAIGPGALEVLHLQNFEIRIKESDDSFSFSGPIQLNAITGLKLRAELGKQLSVATTLNASGLSVGFAQSGGWRADISSLDLEDGQFKSPSTNVKFSLTKLKAGASFDPEKQAVTIDIPAIQRITLASINWTDGANHVLADKPVTLYDTRLKADLHLDSKGDMDRVTVSSLVVPKLDAEHISYSDGELVVEIKKQDGKNDAPDKTKALEIKNIRLTDLTYNIKTGKTSLRTLKTDQIAAQIAASITTAKGKDLDIGAKLTAKSLDVDFVKDGKPVANLKELNGTIGGNVAGAAFNVKLDNLNTSAVIGKDKISIPDLTIDKITVDGLHYDSPKFTLGMDDAGSVLLETISASVDINLNPLPKPGEKAQPRLKNIQIVELKVKKVTAAGITIGLPSLGGLEIRLSEDPKGTIDNLRIDKPAAGSQPFTIAKEGGEWGALGGLAADKADIPKLGLAIKNKLDLTTHATAENIGLSFTPKGGPEVNVETTTLDEIQGQAGPGKFVITKGVQGASKAVVKGLKYANGKVTAKSVVVNGLVYDIEGEKASAAGSASSSIHLDISKAELPTGPDGIALKIEPGKEVVVPELQIDSAHIVIGNVMDLSGGAPAPAGSLPWALTDFKFADALDGHLKATIVTSKIWLPWIRVDFGIRNGVISLDEVESTFGDLKQYVYFEGGKDDIALIIDLSQIYEKFVWGKDSDKEKKDRTRLRELKMPYENQEDRDLGTQKKVKLSHLLATLVPTLSKLIGGTKAVDEEPSSDPPFIDDIKNVHVNISTTKLGTLNFGPRGKIHLGSAGRMGIVALKADSNSLKSEPLRIGIDEANVAVEDLKLGDLGNKGELSIGQIHIAKVDPTNTTLQFDPGPKPGRLEGTVTNAFAKNIRVKLPEDKDDKPEEKK